VKILHRVEKGELKRVIITFPPRHGKSKLASEHFPAWYMGRHPENFVISSTYGQELSDDFGRKVRDQLADPLFQQVFPVCHLRKDTTAVHRFGTEEAGTYFGVGVCGPIVGRGAHLFLIDDPTKNRADAESDKHRRALREWYSSTAYSRLMPGAAIVVIMQRWNQEDLIGYLLKDHAHEKWVVFNMPAIANEGTDVEEPLWPDRYSLEALRQIKKTVGRYNWAAQYQQQPINKETQIFNMDKVAGYETLPKIIFTATAIDPAISKATKACDTASCTLGVGENGHIYDLETMGKQLSFEETMHHIKGVVSRQRPEYLGVEDNGYQKALWEVCNRYFPMVNTISLHSDKDKYRRARTVSHIIEKGLFHTNNKRLIDQMSNFDPEATGEFKKDLVDALVMTLHLIQKYGPFQDDDNEKEGIPLGAAMSSGERFLRESLKEEMREAQGIVEQNINFDGSAEEDPEYY
jgi:hypothetical protein